MPPDDPPADFNDPLRLPSWLGGRLADTVLTPPRQLPPPEPEVLQAEFPHLQLEAMVGRGGMGVVYRAMDLATEQTLALKVILEELLNGGPEFLARFEQEALVLQRLQHPHVVRLIQVGSSKSGWPYLLMEYVDGKDVAQRLLTEKKFSPAVALKITLQVCEALDCAHQLGVIHRDIKPSNILLTADGTVKVADFGLARWEGEAGSSGLTQSFRMMGSLDYQAPETLLLGAGVDERADLYAVGVMLYQMLVGLVPRGIFHLPSKLIPDLDPRIDTVLFNLLQQNPYERTASARDLRTALLEILAGPPAPPAPKPKPWWRPW